MSSTNEQARRDGKLLRFAFSGMFFLVGALIGIFDSLWVLTVIGALGVLLTVASLWVVAHGRNPWWTRSVWDRTRDPGQAPAADWFKRRVGR